jgi:hypothetical protein
VGEDASNAVLRASLAQALLVVAVGLRDVGPTPWKASTTLSALSPHWQLSIDTDFCFYTETAFSL